MRQLQPTVYVSVLALCLNSCGDIWEQATVTIAYASPVKSGEFALLGANRKRVQDAFEEFSERNGYKCRAHVKRIEEITCKGPDDLHLVFQPSLNKEEFVAKFSWADLGRRTHEEFMKHVLNFKNELDSSLRDHYVRIDVQT
jgi:hypothetical protein